MPESSNDAPDAPPSMSRSSSVSDVDGTPVLALVCADRRFELRASDLPGFDRRATGSFFQALLDPETEELKDSSGALVVNSVSVDIVEQTWYYLTTGYQPAIATLSDLIEWRRMCDYFALRVADMLDGVRAGKGVAYATQRYTVVRPLVSAGLSPMCYALQCADMCRLGAAPLGFDDVDHGGALHLRASCHATTPLEVRLEPLSGTLQVRLYSEALWHHVGGHVCLKGKRMVALKVRAMPAVDANAGKYRFERSPIIGDVVELYIHMRSRRRRSAIRMAEVQRAASAEDPMNVCLAKWPSFWCLCRLWRTKIDGGEAAAAFNSSIEICSGGLFVMGGGLIVQVVSQPRSFRKCLMRFCGGGLHGEVRMRLQAPIPFAYTCSHGQGSYGKGTGKRSNGLGPGLASGRKNYGKSVPMLGDPFLADVLKHPEGSSLQRIWVVRRKTQSSTQIVVVLHAMDGRVAVAQLPGENGSIPIIPPRYPKSGNFTRRTVGLPGIERETCLIWNRYKSSYDVPRCHEIMGVALEESNRVAVLHRPLRRSSPQFWVIRSPDLELNERATFYTAAVGKGRGKGGSWDGDRWGTACAREIILPRDILDSVCDGPEGASTGSGSLEAKTSPFPMFAAFGGEEVTETETLRLDGRIQYTMLTDRVLRSASSSTGWGAQGWSGINSADATSSYRVAARTYVPTDKAATWYVGEATHFRCTTPKLPL
mmetsp:Transcript_32034/g.92314  ORF Transcript_32034/g.92314 Transcript_32034/m.92314 type:complete len:710 (+) Transcript_32034:63-2192(+)